MKKYIKPEIRICLLSMDFSLLASSTGVGSDENGIGFGGTDYEGSLEPESRKSVNIWDNVW
jgi:hypothetical protein